MSGCGAERRSRCTGAQETKHNGTKFLSIERSLESFFRFQSPISLHSSTIPFPQTHTLKKIIHLDLRNSTVHKSKKLSGPPWIKDLAQVKGPSTLIILFMSQFSEHHAALSKPNLLSSMSPWTCKGPKQSGCSAGDPGSLPSSKYPLLSKEAAGAQTMPLFPTSSVRSPGSVFSSTKPVLACSLPLRFGVGCPFPLPVNCAGGSWGWPWVGPGPCPQMALAGRGLA